MAQPVARPLDAHRSLHVFLRIMAFAVGAGEIGVAHAAAIVPDPGCATTTLPANDDDNSGPVDLGFPFPVIFGGAPYSKVYIDNNGFVRFRQDPIPWWLIRVWENTTIPVIAPFLADVDTRPTGTQPVTYGQITFAGRSALCINWVQVGYYDRHADKLNSFQLILVDRSDIELGAFDIVMNYDSMTWEAGASGVGGIGGAILPRVGFYDGAHSTELPGSLGTLVLLDGGLNSLSGHSTNDITPGRHVFPIRNGVNLWTVSGTVSDHLGNPLSGALLQACLNGSIGPVCAGARTDGQGHYAFTVTDPAPLASQWSFQVSPPQGSTFLPYSTALNVTGDTQVNVTLNAAFGTPLGTTLQPGTVGSSGVVRVYWQAPLVLNTQGCPLAVAQYTITSGTGSLLQAGVMAESPPLSGHYQANVPALSPAHGYAVVSIKITCPGGLVGTFAFDIYIDPSGTVRTAHGGVPVPGALVTLYRAASPLGPFEVVPDGSAFMSPANRANPDHTDQVGHFGWDVMMGFYVVRVEKAGCVDPNDPSRPYVDTPVLPVPPEWTDLELVLDCPDVTPPELTVPGTITVDATTASGTVVAYTASAVDAVDGPVPVSCTWASGAVFPLGTTTVTCSTTDSSGNPAQASFTVKVTFAWTGVLPPLDAGRRAGFKHGATVPVKFALAGGSRDVHGAVARLFIANLQTPEQELPAESTGHSNVGNLFRFVPEGGVYIFNLSTRPHAPGSYRLRIDLGDGVPRTALLDLTD